MRILLVAQAVSIHTTHWIQQINDQGWDIHLFDAKGSFPHPELDNITEYSLLYPHKIPPRTGPARYGSPIFMKLGWDPFPLSILGFFTRRIFRPRYKQLAQTIERLQPDIIHSFELYSECYPLYRARELLGGDLNVPWMVSLWGSDIYNNQNDPQKVEIIRDIMTACDYLLPDCQRDARLARKFGFVGQVPAIFPGPGSFAVDEMRALLPTAAPSSRRVIALKGYQGWHGRALHVLEALEDCAQLLSDYQIVVYSPSPMVVKKVKQLQVQGKLNIDLLPRSPQKKIFELLGRSRIAIGVNVTDGTPNTMLEAMIMGAFPIQSDTGATAEWIEQGKNGLMVEPENKIALISAIKEGLRNDDLVDSAARINADIAYQRLDTKVLKPAIVEMYRQIAAAGKVKA